MSKTVGTYDYLSGELETSSLFLLYVLLSYASLTLNDSSIFVISDFSEGD
jgi:hypothetical protein